MFGENYVSLTEQRAWFVRLWRRYRPTTGWGVFLLTLSAVVLLPAALVGGELIPGLGPAVTLSIVGFVFGVVARASPHVRAAGCAVHRRWQASSRTCSGAYSSLRPRPLVAQLGGWWTWALGERTAPEPAVTFFREQGAVLGRYFERVAIWVRGLILGPGAPDNLAVIGIDRRCWPGCIAAWAAWWVARRGRALRAPCCPPASFSRSRRSGRPRPSATSLIFLAVTVFLLVLSRLVFQHAGVGCRGRGLRRRHPAGRPV